MGVYSLELTMQLAGIRRSYAVGTFALLCNPWLEGGFVPPSLTRLSNRSCRHGVGGSSRLSEDPVFLPVGEQREEYVRSDYGLVYMGSNLNLSGRPWCFGQVGGVFRMRAASLARGSLSAVKKLTNDASAGFFQALCRKLQNIQVKVCHLPSFWIYPALLMVAHDLT